jgi:general secretion pathway protein D
LRNISYQYDPLTNALLLPHSEWASEQAIPSSLKIQQRGTDVLIIPPLSSSFALSIDGKSLLINPQVTLTTQAPESDKAPLFISLTNANPDEVAKMIMSLYSNVKIQIDSRQRMLAILVNPQDRALIENVVKRFDAGRPQVMFEAEILEVNQDTTQSLGIEYDDLFSFKINETNVPTTSVFGLGKFIRDGGLKLSVGINALKNNGAARVLAQPRITTLDGVEARINSTQTTPIVLTTTAGGNSSVQNITTGITLRMTPKVAPDGTVEATISISVSTPTGTTPSGVPQFSSREASTTVRVANGEPIAIGGLLENRNLQSVKKVPFLGDIPFIGELFTTTRTETHNTDLIIIVTPRLVNSINNINAANPVTVSPLITNPTTVNPAKP